MAAGRTYRYEALAPVADEVLQAARPFVDVFSFQHFGPVEKIRADLDRFGKAVAKPVLLADSAGNLVLPDGTKRNDPAKYAATMAALRDVPACVGFHLCGAQPAQSRPRPRSARSRRKDGRRGESLASPPPIARWRSGLKRQG